MRFFIGNLNCESSGMQTSDSTQSFRQCTFHLPHLIIYLISFGYLFFERCARAVLPSFVGSLKWMKQYFVRWIIWWLKIHALHFFPYPTVALNDAALFLVFSSLWWHVISHVWVSSQKQTLHFSILSIQSSTRIKQFDPRQFFIVTRLERHSKQFDGLS